MAPDRASAKLCGLLKTWGLIRRTPSSAGYTQLHTYILYRTRTPFFRRKCAQVHLSTGKDAESLPAGTSACNLSVGLRSTRSCIQTRLCRSIHTHSPHMRMTSAKYGLLYTADADQPGSSMPVRRCGLQSNLFCNLRSFTAMALRQNLGVQPERCCRTQKPRMHSAESQAANTDMSRDKVTGEEEDSKGKEAGSKQVAHEEALRGFEALLDRMEAAGGSGDHRVGATCLRLAQLCDLAGIEPSRILSYGQRALRTYKSAELSWEHVTCLHVIGHAYFKMGDFDNATAHLEQSASILKRLKLPVSEKDVDTLVHARESLLGQAKMSLGRFREALPHFQTSIKLAERLVEPGNPDLGVAYFQAAQAYKEAKDPEEAICLCIKAVDNHAKYYGPKSSQAAEIRKFMSMVYFDLREYENALLEHEVVRPIFEGLGRFEDVASLDLIAVESLVELERFDEAISMLKGVVNSVPESSLLHGNALVMLAKAHAIMKDHEGATKYCTMALHVLENQQLSTDAGSSLVHLALVFQRQQEIELATTTYKKALEIFNQCSGYEAHAAAADVEGQIGFLLLHSEKVEEALPFLERSVSKKKDIHGANSEELLDVHNHLGVAYSEEGKLDEALQQFEAAKLILSKNITEVDSLTISVYSNLSNMYSVFGRFEDAIVCQKTVVNSIERNRDVETVVSLDEAKRILKDLQQEAEAQEKESMKGSEK